MAGRGFLLTGTDTNCGKTTVTVALTRLLREQGRGVWPLKPIASGAEWKAGNLESEDTRLLAEVSGRQPADVTFATLQAAAAPAAAARMEGKLLCLDELVDWIGSCFRENTMTLVEGVGGLLCPLTATETVADLALRLRIPLLIVTRRALGTLNHTLLTLEAAKSRGLAVAGVIVSETVPVEGVAQETCLEELQKRMSVPLLARLPYDSHQRKSRLADCENVDWWQLAGEYQSCRQ